jgi:hypothetical protein
VDGVGVLVVEEEQVDEAGGVALLLPGRVEPGAGLVVAHAADEFLDGGRDLVHGVGLYLVVRGLTSSSG